MDGGVIYMYYARGGGSLNFSAAGANAAADQVRSSLGRRAFGARGAGAHAGAQSRRGGGARPPHKLCAGQTLLCRALGLKVPDWDARRFDQALYVEDVGERPSALVRCARLGIPAGRDEHLQYRYVDPAYAAFCTRNPLRRGRVAGRDYVWVDGRDCRRRAGRSRRSACSARQAPADVRALRQAPFQAERSAASRARRSIEASISAYFCRTRRRFRRRLQAYSGIRGSEPKPSIRYSPGLPSALRP